MKNSIGIIGGVGPYAGLDLNKKIFDNMKTNGTDQDFIDVFLISRSSDITDRTKYLSGEEDTNPANGLYRSALALEKLGATVMAIPCNTAHSPKIYNRLKELLELSGSHAKLLHIVEETHKFLEANYPNIEKVGLLGTLGTYRTKLYENYFREKNCFELVLPDEEGQKCCHDAIYNREYGVKAYSSPVTPKARSLFETEMDHLGEKGAQCVILGCTEIPLAFIDETHYKQLLLVDPTMILARALIQNADISHLKAI